MELKNPDKEISFEELLNILQKSSIEFHPPLNTRVVLDDYCKKLIKRGIFFTKREDGN